MAHPDRRLATNVDGDFYVDDTCIDCDTCRWMAPSVFDRADGQSRVHAQPADPLGVRRANMALLSCPTRSIGTARPDDMAAAVSAFPDPIDGPVHHCGYHSEKSYGAASYLIVRPDGNVLVDSPRFAAPLVERIEALGGVRTLFLTHRDDVADHAKFRERFGCERILHRRDLTADTRDVEHVIDGDDPVEIDHDLLVIPTPGHTEGSACLLHREEHLFSGDHVAWNEPRQRLYAFRSVCWFDWRELGRSMRKLAGHRFSWVLPGHGRRAHLPPDAMAREVSRCADEILTE